MEEIDKGILALEKTITLHDSLYTYY